ncbi:hypothetical protein ACR9YC_02095 [Parasphingorhabdus sp. DH2-15]|uniref:hypothetical protein n=1 Tax=Parasphingorhabdus sp. DH2-15 TaxID=3444112 RepID=UPI003F685042
MAEKKEKHNQKVCSVYANTKTVITVDYKRYAHFLDDANDLTEDQKQEFVQAIWNIITEFIRNGFRVDALHQAGVSCGQVEHTSNYSPDETPDTIQSDHHTLANKFVTAGRSHDGSAVDGAGP